MSDDNNILKAYCIIAWWIGGDFCCVSVTARVQGWNTLEEVE